MSETNSRKLAVWWGDMEVECPITLEPLASLPYPPFELVDDKNGSRNGHYYDGFALVCRQIASIAPAC